MQGFGEIVPGDADSSRLTFHLPTSINISQFQSNETFLLKIANSLFEAAQSGCVTVLVALAFIPSTTRYWCGFSSTCSASTGRSVWRSSISKDAHDLSRSVTPCQLHLALTLTYSKNPSWIHCIFTFLKCLLPHSAM